MVAGGCLALSPASASDSTTALINKLIERGILTQDDAYEPTLPLETVDDRIQARKWPLIPTARSAVACRWWS